MSSERSERPGTMSASSLDIARIQADFPILKRQVNGHRLVYLDSASSAQKPQSVLDAMDRIYRESYANVHRGVYTIAEEATAAFEQGRAKVARFVGARESREIVFTRNATESINLVAYSWARANLREGDVIVLSHLEHHANIIPWHILREERGVDIRWIPLTADQRDMVLLLHELDVEYPGQTRAPERIRSTLTVKGELGGFTAMSKTVGLPVAIAAKLLLRGELTLTGSLIPTHPSIYIPVLQEVERAGLRFVEKSESKNPIQV